MAAEERPYRPEAGEQNPAACLDNCPHASSVRLISLPERLDDRGSLIVVEGGNEIQFAIKRAFFFYDVPGGATRGGHAHRTLQEFFLALSGSFIIVTDDGVNCSQHLLDNPSLGLYVGPMNWVELKNFSVGSVCLVLASTQYDETDYYREYGEFIRDKTNVS
ncbi:MAG: FdtA/QdtA family cupin domain-containing protein [Actinomycetota bacterium]|nr:FdtA/QdtA family cupin domain-containing protein [Actinomycetota bacterium]